MRYEYKSPTQADIDHVIANLRQADKDEIDAAYGWEPKTAVEHSVEVSRDTVSAGYVDGRCAFLRGVAISTFVSNAGWVWMVATADADAHAVPFLRSSAGWINEVRWDYAKLLNFVDARNVASLKWLKWLGFTIYPAKPFGPLRMPFHKFELINFPEC